MVSVLFAHMLERFFHTTKVGHSSRKPLLLTCQIVKTTDKFSLCPMVIGQNTLNMQTMACICW